MIYIIYLCVAVGVTFMSVKAADYVDLIEQKTDLSGAFIGGVMLSAVTSLPELFTSISSAVMIGEAGLCIGNILGSNLFNCLILAVLALVFIKSFAKADIAAGHRMVLLCTFVGYIAIAGNLFGLLSVEIATVSIASVVIAVAYAASIKYLAGEDGEEADEECSSPLTLTQIILRFVLVSLAIIALSIVISYVTDAISVELGLGKGIAGALFMGIATSLPELSSTIALFRKKCYDIAVGNIVGSNVFNLVILTVTDVLYTGGSVYDFSDPKTLNLLVFGMVSIVATYVAIKSKEKMPKIISCIVIIASYAAFLII